MLHIGEVKDLMESEQVIHKEGQFWRTGLESCAFRPFIDTATSTASKTLSEEGSKSKENHLRLPIKLVADRKA